MIEIAICDDQIIHCRIAEKMILQYSKIRKAEFHITIFTSGKELLKSDISFDIVFLDIEMGSVNGMVIGKEYAKKHKTIIILLTSHDEEMQNGYKIKAFRFLVKPINVAEIFEALDSALEEFYSVQKIQVCNETGQLIINIHDVIYFEAGDRRVGVRTESGFYEVRDVLKNILEQLNPLEFYMPHRTYVVNMKFVSEVKEMYIILTTGEKIKISRLKRQDFKDKFFEYLHRKARDE